MEKLKKYKGVFVFIVAIITTFCISIELVNNQFNFNGNDFRWIIVLAFVYIVINNALKNVNKRLVICALIFGFITAGCAITGRVAEKYLVDNLLIAKKDIFFYMCKFEVFFVAISSIAAIIMRELPNIIAKLKEKKELKFFTANKRSILIVAIILFIAYLPYLLYYYPGNVLIDSVVQIMQGMGNSAVTTHHPPIHTGLITLCVKVGHFLTGSYNFGAFLYTLSQTLATCFIFSFAIYYMARKGVPRLVRLISLIYYALCPTISFLTITMYKDIPFALFMLLLTICMVEIATNRENFVKSKLRMIITAIIVFGACIFRNNGLYAIILTFLVLLIVIKKYKIRVCSVFLAGILMCLIVTGPIYNILGIQKGDSKETFSVILQQFARIKKYKGNELTQEEKDAIYKYLPVDNIEELYNPVFSDPVKHEFSEEAFQEDKIGLFKTYFKLAIKYPMQTVASLICNSFGYYYPNTLGWGVYTGVNDECFTKDADYGIVEHPLVSIPVLDKINEFVNSRNLPIVSMFLSIGFLFWMVVFGIIYCIYTKKYNLILTYIPVLFMWLTILASPVFGEPRYVYSLFTCLPLLLPITFSYSKGEKDA